jgi:hypothetical protein
MSSIMMIDNNATTTTTTIIDWSDHYNDDEDSSIFNPSYTYSNDKYSCVVAFYHIHIVLNYIIFLSGFACLVTRLIPTTTCRIIADGKYNLHSWFGRLYILSMLWSTSVSLLINNEGLPLAVLVSFVAVMGGLTIGWILIIIHKQNINTKATQIVQNKLINMNSNIIKNGGDGGAGNENNKDNNTNKNKNNSEIINLNKMMNDATMEIVNSKTFAQRLFSLKAAHGILFFISWMQIAGRIFNGGDGEFSCRSYPVYKPIDAPHIPDEAVFDVNANNENENKHNKPKQLKLIPIHDPRWDELPWSGGPVTWALLIILASAIVAIVGAIIFSCFFLWRSKKQTKQQRNETISAPKDIEEEEEVAENRDNKNNLYSSSEEEEEQEGEEKIESFIN